MCVPEEPSAVITRDKVKRLAKKENTLSVSRGLNQWLVQEICLPFVYATSLIASLSTSFSMEIAMPHTLRPCQVHKV